MGLKRFRESYAGNASKLHIRVGEVLKSGIFSGYKIYQEYPVSRINPSYSNNSHKFDWVVLDLKLVIECHGQQHFQPVTFGSMSDEEALLSFSDQKYRDQHKREAAEGAGFTYIMIPYTDINKVTDKYIYSLYQQNFNHCEFVDIPTHDDKVKQQNREYRKQMYRRLKELNKKQE